MNEKSNSQTTVPPADVEQDTGDGALATSPFTPFDSPVSIHVHSIRKRDVDADGISAKAAIDALVVAGLLHDDSPKFVKEVSYSQEKGSEEETLLIIEETENDAI